MKKFYRKNSKLCCGLIQGIGDYINVDANLLRIIILMIIIGIPHAFFVICALYYFFSICTPEE